MPKLTLAEMAREYKKSPKTFKKYVLALGIPHEPLGRSMLFDPHVVSAYLVTSKKVESNVVKFTPRKRSKKVVSKRFAEAV